MTTATRAVRLDEDHRYWVGSLNVPGFSEILESMGFPKNPFWTPDGRAEGEALHKWLLFLAMGNEPTSEPDARIAGRVRGICKFFKEHSFEFEGGETPLYNRLGYCCTPDLWGRLDGASAVIEAKRGARMKRHRLQTAAQKLALEDNEFQVEKRFSLYLKDDGYSLEEHDDYEDIQAWQIIAGAFNAREIYK